MCEAVSKVPAGILGEAIQTLKLITANALQEIDKQANTTATIIKRKIEALNVVHANQKRKRKKVTKTSKTKAVSRAGKKKRDTGEPANVEHESVDNLEPKAVLDKEKSAVSLTVLARSTVKEKEPSEDSPDLSTENNGLTDNDYKIEAVTFEENNTKKHHTASQGAGETSPKARVVRKSTRNRRPKQSEHVAPLRRSKRHNSSTTFERDNPVDQNIFSQKESEEKLDTDTVSALSTKDKISNASLPLDLSDDKDVVSKALGNVVECGGTLQNSVEETTEWNGQPGVTTDQLKIEEVVLLDKKDDSVREVEEVLQTHRTNRNDETETDYEVKNGIETSVAVKETLHESNDETSNTRCDTDELVDNDNLVESKINEQCASPDKSVENTERNHQVDTSPRSVVPLMDEKPLSKDNDLTLRNAIQAVDNGVQLPENLKERLESNFRGPDKAITTLGTSTAASKINKSKEGIETKVMSIVSQLESKANLGKNNDVKMNFTNDKNKNKFDGSLETKMKAAIKEKPKHSNMYINQLRNDNRSLEAKKNETNTKDNSRPTYSSFHARNITKSGNGTTVKSLLHQRGQLPANQAVKRAKFTSSLYDENGRKRVPANVLNSTHFEMAKKNTSIPVQDSKSQEVPDASTIKEVGINRSAPVAQTSNRFGKQVENVGPGKTGTLIAASSKQVSMKVPLVPTSSPSKRKSTKKVAVSKFGELVDMMSSPRFDKENLLPQKLVEKASTESCKKQITDTQQYEISPYKSCSDSEDDDDDRPSKPVPSWARHCELGAELRRQYLKDPDKIFQNKATSCSLTNLFKHKGNKRKPDFSRRSSSGDWAEDKLTWQEEVEYRRTMGFKF